MINLCWKILDQKPSASHFLFFCLVNFFKDHLTQHYKPSKLNPVNCRYRRPIRMPDVTSAEAREWNVSIVLADHVIIPVSVSGLPGFEFGISSNPPLGTRESLSTIQSLLFVIVWISSNCFLYRFNKLFLLTQRMSFR